MVKYIVRKKKGVFGMKTFAELYQEKKMDPKQLLELIQDHDYIFCAQAASEPDAILQHMAHLKNTGVRDVVFNTCLPIHKYEWFHDEELRGILQHNAWFFNGDLRKAQKNKMVSDIPQHSTSVLKKVLFRAKHDGRRPVLMATVAPMDEDGYLSLSISAVYENELVREGALVLLEVNPNYPRTFGDTMIHISEVDALVESDRPIPEVPYGAYGETDAIIGKHIASLVEDGSTIQLGIGNIPNAVANELKSRKHLGIHSEMFTENMVDLAFTPDQKSKYGLSAFFFHLDSSILAGTFEGAFFLKDGESITIKDLPGLGYNVRLRL
jgi:acyl-CoA hydrolase